MGSEQSQARGHCSGGMVGAARGGQKGMDRRESQQVTGRPVCLAPYSFQSNLHLLRPLRFVSLDNHDRY